MISIKWFVLLVVLFGVGYFLFSGDTLVVAPAPATGPITLGFIGPLSGEAKNLGANARAAVEIAVDEVNAAGGINGRSLTMVYEDGKCASEDAIGAAAKLITVDRVPVIIGGACSNETMAFTSLAEQSKTVVLSYCSSAPKLTQAGDYIFRDYPSDFYQGNFAAHYIYSVLQKQNVAVLYPQTDWGTGIKDEFTKNFTTIGGKVLIAEGYEQATRDLRGQLTKIKELKPDLLYFLGYAEESIAGLKQAKELKLGVPMFGGDTWDDAKIVSGAGKAAEGIMYPVGYMPLSVTFKAKMKEKTSSDVMTVCAPAAYDAVHIMAQLIAQVGTDPTAIKNGLYGARYQGGVSSADIQFDMNGDIIGADYVVNVVKNGKAVEMK